MAHGLTPRPQLVFATSLLVLFALASDARAADGELDSRFGWYGIVPTPITLEAIAVPASAQRGVAFGIDIPTADLGSPS